MELGRRNLDLADIERLQSKPQRKQPFLVQSDIACFPMTRQCATYSSDAGEKVRGKKSTKFSKKSVKKPHKNLLLPRHWQVTHFSLLHCCSDIW